MIKQDQKPSNKFKFCIDRGGTFTDIYAQLPDNTVTTKKLLSDDPSHYRDASKEGIRRIINEYHATINKKPLSGEELIPCEHIAWIRMGTTVGTNALLERQGHPTIFIVTEGFRDLLAIGDQARANIFDITVKKPKVLYSKVIEAQERVWPDGKSIKVIKALNTQQLKDDLIAFIKNHDQQEKVTEVYSIAICLLHSYQYNKHELTIKNICQQLGFKHISTSSLLTPVKKAVSRGNTCCVNAYLSPTIKNYLNTFAKGFAPFETKDSGGNKVYTSILEVPGMIQFMQSDGGLTAGATFHGFKAILSGPAGGVVGYCRTTPSKNLDSFDFDVLTSKLPQKSRQDNQGHRLHPIIGFDMGGTSTDISRFQPIKDSVHQNYDLVFETKTAGVQIQAPQLDIKTVAAGGGSRLFFRNNTFDVGPESAQAHPGPCCYQKDGFLALSDANLFLGRLLPQYFPKIFGANENKPLSYEASKQALIKITAKINAHEQYKNLSLEEVASGFIKVANEKMCKPIREMSEARGYRVKDHILSCFGGAAPQHVCAIARILKIKKAFVHRYGGILSAYGMGLADVTEDKSIPSRVVTGEPLATDSTKEPTKDYEKLFIGLEQEVIVSLRQQGFSDNQILLQRFFKLTLSR